jgi:hypothetical protein
MPVPCRQGRRLSAAEMPGADTAAGACGIETEHELYRIFCNFNNSTIFLVAKKCYAKVIIVCADDFESEVIPISNFHGYRFLYTNADMLSFHLGTSK